MGRLGQGRFSRHLKLHLLDSPGTGAIGYNKITEPLSSLDPGVPWWRYRRNREQRWTCEPRQSAALGKTSCIPLVSPCPRGGPNRMWLRWDERQPFRPLYSASEPIGEARRWGPELSGWNWHAPEQEPVRALLLPYACRPCTYLQPTVGQRICISIPRCLRVLPGCAWTGDRLERAKPTEAEGRGSLLSPAATASFWDFRMSRFSVV